MAKFDEADPRWLVQKREDGTNVNAWHWVEKDAIAWSRRRLGELFEGAVLVESPRIVATGLESLTGDAFLNNRKAKIVASYELKLTVGWKGTAADGGEGAGTVELPYLADENEDEDTEVRVAAADDGAASAELRDAVLRRGGREAVRRLVATYVEELKSGAPLKGAAGADDDGAAAAEAKSGAAAAAAGGAAAGAAAGGKGAAAAASKPAAAAAAKPKASSRTTLSLERQFYCRPADLFECFTVEGRLRAFTMSPATVDPRPGGAFTWFGGSVTGTFVALEPPGRLVLDWRFSSWEDGCVSRVELKLAEPEPGNTVLTLSQTGIPEADRFGNGDVKQQVESGWDGQVFSRIKQVFGFGA